MSQSSKIEMTWNFDVHGNCTIDTPWSLSVDLSTLNKKSSKERLSDVYLVEYPCPPTLSLLVLPPILTHSLSIILTIPVTLVLVTTLYTFSSLCFPPSLPHLPCSSSSLLHQLLLFHVRFHPPPHFPSLQIQRLECGSRERSEGSRWRSSSC